MKTLSFSENEVFELYKFYQVELQKAEEKITLAEEEYIRAQDKLKWSQRLFDEKYLSTRYCSNRRNPTQS